VKNTCIYGYSPDGYTKSSSTFSVMACASSGSAYQGGKVTSFGSDGLAIQWTKWGSLSGTINIYIKAEG